MRAREWLACKTEYTETLGSSGLPLQKAPFGAIKIMPKYSVHVRCREGYRFALSHPRADHDGDENGGKQRNNSRFEGAAGGGEQSTECDNRERKTTSVRSEIECAQHASI